MRRAPSADVPPMLLLLLLRVCANDALVRVSPRTTKSCSSVSRTRVRFGGTRNARDLAASPARPPALNMRNMRSRRAASERVVHEHNNSTCRARRDSALIATRPPPRRAACACLHAGCADRRRPLEKSFRARASGAHTSNKYAECVCMCCDRVWGGLNQRKIKTTAMANDVGGCGGSVLASV